MNSRTDTFIISSHGLKPIAVMAVITLLFYFIDFEFLGFISFVVLACLTYSHRNPERVSHFIQSGAVLSPVDGKIKEINSIEKSPIDGKPGFELVVESGFMDIAILRAPLTSKMKIDALQRGAMLKSTSSLSALNENASVRFSTDAGDLVVKHTLKSWARPLSFAIAGEISQNQRYGYMLKGTSSIFLPSNSRVAVKEGMHIKAGESVIGFFSETV